MSEQLIRGFHHIALRASDFEKSVDFYTQALELRICAAWGGPGERKLMLDLGDGGRIELFEGGTQPAVENGAEYGSWFHLALRSNDVDRAFARAIEAGAREKIAPKDVVLASEPPIPARLAFVYGPSGEVIEFFDQKA